MWQHERRIRMEIDGVGEFTRVSSEASAQGRQSQPRQQDLLRGDQNGFADRPEIREPAFRMFRFQLPDPDGL